MAIVVAPTGLYKVHVAHVSVVGFESCGSTDASDVGYIVWACDCGKLDNILIGHKGQKGPSDCAIHVMDGSSGSVENFDVQTNTDANSRFITGSIIMGNLGASGGHGPNGIFFKNVTVSGNGNGTGGPIWAYIGNSAGSGTVGVAPDWFEAGGGQTILRGATFEGCNWDGGLPLNNLPQYPTRQPSLGISGATIGQIMWCTDSPTTTPGTVLSASVAANAIAAAGASAIRFSDTGFPPAIVATWKVYGPTRQNQMNGVPTVSSLSSSGGNTTVNITAGGVWGSGPGVAVGDVISFFAPGGGSNRVPLRFSMLSGGVSIGWVVTA